MWRIDGCISGLLSIHQLDTVSLIPRSTGDMVAIIRHKRLPRSKDAFITCTCGVADASSRCVVDPSPSACIRHPTLFVCPSAVPALCPS